MASSKSILSSAGHIALLVLALVANMTVADPLGLFVPQPDYVSLARHKHVPSAAKNVQEYDWKIAPDHESRRRHPHDEVLISNESQSDLNHEHGLREVEIAEDREDHTDSKYKLPVQTLLEVISILKPKQVDTFINTYLRDGDDDDLHALYDALSELMADEQDKCHEQDDHVHTCNEARRKTYDDALHALGLRFAIDTLPLAQVEPFVVNYLRNASPSDEWALERVAGRAYKSSPHPPSFKKGKPTFFLPEDADGTAFSRRDIHIHLHGNLDSTTGTGKAEKRDAPNEMSVKTEVLIKRQTDDKSIVKRSVETVNGAQSSFTKRSVNKQEAFVKRAPTHYVMPHLPKP